MSLDVSKLEHVEAAGGKLVARCPVCASNGRDRKGNNLVAYEDGRGAFACRAGCDTKEIFKLAGAREERVRPLTCRVKLKRNFTLRPLPTSAAYDLRGEYERAEDARVAALAAALPALLVKHRTTLADIVTAAPVEIRDRRHEFELVMSLFPDEPVWIGDMKGSSGGPWARKNFHLPATWLRDYKHAPYVYTTPFTYVPERLSDGVPGADGQLKRWSRCKATIARRLYMVLEFDGFGLDEEGLIAQCTRIRIIERLYRLRLRMVLTSAGKSLHAWFDAPGVITTERIRRAYAVLGLDRAILSYSQPCRIPSAMRPASEKGPGGRQQLFFFQP